MAALVATGAILSGCSKKEVEEPEIRNNPDITDNIVTVTTTINLDENDATKALAIDYDEMTLTKTFAVGDKIAVIYHNKSGNLDKAESVALTESDLYSGGKSAKITVTMTNPEAYKSVKLIYPASRAGTDDVDYSKLKNQTRKKKGKDGSMLTIPSSRIRRAHLQASPHRSTSPPLKAVWMDGIDFHPL